MKRTTVPAKAMSISPVPVVIERTINEFIHLEVSGSLVLLVATIVALILANSPWADAYFRLWKTPIGFKLGDFEFFETLHHWINDVLMAFFFFVAGLEIKREVLVGELSTRARHPCRSLPPWAAWRRPPPSTSRSIRVGRAVAGASRWPPTLPSRWVFSPCSAIGCRRLKVFLTALAIVDDIGAVLVIAIFYTDQLDLSWLAIGAGLLLLLLFFPRSFKLRSKRLVFLTVALVIWFAFFESGLPRHAGRGAGGPLSSPAASVCKRPGLCALGPRALGEGSSGFINPTPTPWRAPRSKRSPVPYERPRRRGPKPLALASAGAACFTPSLALL